MYTSFKTAISISLALALTACADDVSPPVKKYNGEQILQPIKLLGAVHIGQSTTTPLHTQSLNIATTCDYRVGSKKGRFTTPAVIYVPLTDKKQELSFKCRYTVPKRSANFILPKRTLQLPAVKITKTASINSSWNRWSSERYHGYLIIPNKLRIPSGLWTDKQFKAAVEDHGVQTFYSTLILVMNGTYP
jgi:hypothetical protein